MTNLRHDNMQMSFNVVAICSLCVCVGGGVCLSMFVCVSISTFVCLSVRLSSCLSVYLAVSSSVMAEIAWYKPHKLNQSQAGLSYVRRHRRRQRRLNWRRLRRRPRLPVESPTTPSIFPVPLSPPAAPSNIDPKDRTPRRWAPLEEEVTAGPALWGVAILGRRKGTTTKTTRSMKEVIWSRSLLLLPLFFLLFLLLLISVPLLFVFLFLFFSFLFI